MTLNASGPISLAGTTAGQSIEVELGGTGTTTITLNDATVRSLAGVATGTISMPSNFWGKSNQYILARTFQSKLVGVPYTAFSTFYVFQGFSTAISDDGNTLAVGAFEESSASDLVGATYIFTRSGSSWTQQAKLIGTGWTVGSYPFQGYCVSLSSDGNTLAVGGYGNNNNTGAVWIFTRSGSSWTQQTQISGSGIGNFAYSVCLSSDGTTLAVGRPGSSVPSNSGVGNAIGSTLIYIYSGGSWSLQATLVGSGNSGNSSQGASVSLSADGNTLAIGAVGDTNPSVTTSVGAVWIFTRSGSSWTQQGSKLQANNYVLTTYNVNFGYAVSLSSDGNTLAIGGYGDSRLIGAAWIYTRSGSTWTQGPKLTASGGTGIYIRYGWSISLSGDGKVLAVGGPGDNATGPFNGIGAAWVYNTYSGSWTLQGSKLVPSYLGTLPQIGASAILARNTPTLSLGSYSDGAGGIFIGATNIYI